MICQSLSLKMNSCQLFIDFHPTHPISAVVEDTSTLPFGCWSLAPRQKVSCKVWSKKRLFCTHALSQTSQRTISRTFVRTIIRTFVISITITIITRYSTFLEICLFSTILRPRTRILFVHVLHQGLFIFSRHMEINLIFISFRYSHVRNVGFYLQSSLSSFTPYPCPDCRRGYATKM